MAKRSQNVRKCEPTDVEVATEVVESILDETPVTTVNLILMRNVTLTTKGSITGKEYHWSGAGASVPVDEPDVESLLARGTYKSCCGSRGSSYFEIGG